MILRGNKQLIDDYFSDESISQSYLKQLIKGVKHLGKDERTMYYEEKGHLIIGSAVDTVLTMPFDVFYNTYHTTEIQNKPSPAIMSIVQKVADITEVPVSEEPVLEFFPDEILESCDIHSYQKNWKAETRIAKIVKEGSHYFEELIKSRGKQVISRTEKNIIDNISVTLESHDHTRKYFIPKAEHIDIFFQVPIYFEYNGVSCKSLLDIVIIDRKEKLITPVDIKTTAGETKNFPSSVTAFRYDFQGAFYVEALKSIIGDTLTGHTPIEEIGRLRDYRIDNFRFAVETTSVTKSVDEHGSEMTTYNQGTPLSFILTEQRRKLAKEGRPELFINVTEPRANLTDKVHPITFREIIGTDQAIELYKWHLSNGFDNDREVIESNGELLIK